MNRPLPPPRQKAESWRQGDIVCFNERRRTGDEGGEEWLMWSPPQPDDGLMSTAYEVDDVALPCGRHSRFWLKLIFT